MTDDLVARLRERADANRLNEVCGEAAAEIKLLRGLLERNEGRVKEIVSSELLARAEKAEAERDRTQSVLEETVASMGESIIRIEAERDALRKDAERLIDACNGMIGLIQLIASRDDLPTGLDDLMLLNHRVTEAKAAIDAASAAAGESPARPQP